METKQNVPKLRFPKFTDAWEQRKLSDLAEIIGGGTPDTNIPAYWDGDIDWYAPAEMEGQRYASSSVRKITELGLQKSSAKMLPAQRTVLFTSRAGIGKMAILQRPAATNQGFQSLVLKDGTEPYFIYSMGVNIKEMAEGVASGSTFLEISGKMLGNLEVMVPTLKEQEAIAAFFRNIDDLITLHQRKCDELKKLKKGMLQKIFPKDGANVPEIRFPGFDEAWEQRKVQDIYKITRGYVLAAPETSESESEETPYPVYSSQTKNNGLMGYYKDYLYENAITWTTDGANAGTVNYRAGKFYCTNVCGVLLSDEGYSNKCAAEALNSVAWKWVSHVGNPKLMNNVMGEIPITLPKSIEEQNKISEFFVRIDTLITLHQRKCDELKELKKGLLQQMFI